MKLWSLSCLSELYFTYKRANEFCTKHDSKAVMPYVEFCSDHFITFWMRASRNAYVSNVPNVPNVPNVNRHLI